MGDQEKPQHVQLKRQVQGKIAQATGHRYPVLHDAVDGLSRGALLDLLRLIDNLKMQTISENRKRKRGQFWG